ncbi:MAG: GSU2403 family nucleotidyltransferase fold protein [Sulfuricella sp.]|nr:GSU2403 family nucleotidyltransferase fold protein [Sulfuricella sp.]
MTKLDFPYKKQNMENTRKNIGLIDIGNDARRQFIDAQSVFTAWEGASRSAADVRGGMYWKHQGKTDYLIRTSPDNTQKSLGPRSDETTAIHEKFIARKATAEARVAQLAAELTRHQRMNRALFVGRAPQMLVDILNTLSRAGISEHFTVVGTHALYAYEAAAGVRIGSSDALATQDVDLLWDTRKRVVFATQMKVLGSSMLGLLRKVDSTFEIRQDQRYTAVNGKGFEVDIIRREASEGDPHPLRLTDHEDDIWAIQAKRAGALLSGPRFSSMIVSSSGYMARIETISPLTFVKFKRWMAAQPDRDSMKTSRDGLQADIVQQLIDEYLPHLGQGDGI